MKISVIIPVYNVELYVRQCLESVIMQDNGGADMECVLVDDCGKDRSMEIVRQIVADYQGPIQFVLLAHEHNRGLSAARNTGMDAATGDYILFVDSDDWLPADAISKFVNALKMYPDLDMVIGNFYLRSRERLFYNVEEETLLDNYHVRKLLVWYKNGVGGAWAKIVKTEIVKKCRFKEGIIYEDLPWSYSLFKDIDKALLIPDNTYFYENNHSGSITLTLKNKENVPKQVRSVSFGCKTVLDAPYKDLFAGSIMFLWRSFFKTYRMQFEQKMEENERQQIKQLRGRIVRTCFKRGRWFVALFFVFMTYPPTSYLYNIRFVRRKFDAITENAKKIAFFLEKFHKRHVF